MGPLVPGASSPVAQVLLLLGACCLPPTYNPQSDMVSSSLSAHLEYCSQMGTAHGRTQLAASLRMHAPFNWDVQHAAGGHLCWQEGGSVHLGKTERCPGTGEKTSRPVLPFILLSSLSSSQMQPFSTHSWSVIEHNGIFF